MDYCTVIKKSLLILTVYIDLTSAGCHSLQYFYTTVTPGIHFPAFTIVGLVDGEQIHYYDSNIRKMISRNEWIKKADADDTEYWHRGTRIAQGDQKTFEENLAISMQRFNHTEGVHTFQWMYGCEQLDAETVRGYLQFGYDGEDFLSLDLNSLTYTAANDKAVITKHKWEQTHAARFQKAYLENECTEWLLKYVEYGRSSLEKEVPPEVSLFQKDSSSPVVCHATGFFPKAVNISWQKNGEDLHEDVELRETLPNQDGTFQKRSVLTVSPEELDRNEYTCTVQHSSLEKKMHLPRTDRRVLSGGGSFGIIIGVVVAFLLLVFFGGVFIAIVCS
ncbi:H-2 class I histocompatibility antigen, Q9 alpha chain-like isoform X1 [Pygocentrus nattereri]|uniref:Ig-like domain-containing protein n=2 Tax=Pygocentrus nattereri TaxID=42514 RepID=A0AAR2K6A6_PYGNA|nr:H-2 class I histocompatibility antigen, Q9 alpha chain-like isoform X1 [Pygocentrus nattereri]